LMMTPSRYRGFASFDALFSLVPVMLMLFFLLSTGAYLVEEASERMERQVVFDKLVSIADYTMKSGAVVRNGTVRYPNWLDEKLMDADYVEDLRQRAGLERLHISTGGTAEAAFCLYRLAVVGDDRKPAKLFVCGG